MQCASNELECAKVIYLLIFFLALWTVINEGSNQVRLHNNFNYLAIVNGQTMVIHKVRADHFYVILDFIYVHVDRYIFYQLNDTVFLAIILSVGMYLVTFNISQGQKYK